MGGWWGQWQRVINVKVSLSNSMLLWFTKVTLQVNLHKMVLYIGKKEIKINNRCWNVRGGGGNALALVGCWSLWILGRLDMDGYGGEDWDDLPEFRLLDDTHTLDSGHGVSLIFPHPQKNCWVECPPDPARQNPSTTTTGPRSSVV